MHPSPLRVLIVGAGPVGTVAGIAMLRAIPRVEVTILDRARFPRDKACADLVGPRARHVLDDLDLGHLLAPFGRTASFRVEATSTSKKRRPKLTLGPFATYAVPRISLDSLLLDAVSKAGAEVLERTEFLGFSRTPSQRLRAEWRETEESVSHTREFDIVVGADGAYSDVRTAMGISHPDRRDTFIAMRGYAPYAGTNARSDCVLDFSAGVSPGHGWIIPMDDEQANVGVMISVTGLRRRKLQLPDLFDDYIHDLSAQGVPIGTPARLRSHQLPHASSGQRLTHDRDAAVLLGDAGAMANPFTGETLFYGFSAAALLADVLALAASTTDFRPAVALAEFERQFRDRFGAHYRRWARTRRLAESRFGNDVVIRALSVGRWRRKADKP